MAKPNPSSPDGRRIPPRVDRNGKIVTSRTTTEGIEIESIAADIMCAAGSTDEASYQMLCQLLAQPHALPEFASSSGITPLMAAVTVGNAKGVELLASHPLVNLSRCDKDGWTALHYAAECGYPDCIRALLAHHAPVNIRNDAGETPFDLATDERTQAAFWENRDFVRHMKQQHPEHPRFQPEAETLAPRDAEAAAPPAPPASPVWEAFTNAAESVSLEWTINPPMDVKGSLIAKVAAMNREELQETSKTIRLGGGAFDWSGVFIAASYLGNIEAMCFLHDEFLFDQRTLNQALSASVARGDQRSAAHHLLVWGANPNAPHELEGQYRDSSIFDAARRLLRADMIEEMCLWSRDPVGKKSFQVFESWRKGLVEVDDTGGFRVMTVAIDAHNARKNLARAGRGKLSTAFNGAVVSGDLAVVMGAYAEGRVDRLIRGRMDFSRDAGGGAIALALRHERYDFARMLIADGYHLKDAPERLKIELERKGTQAAKDFAAAHLSGTLKVESVEDVGRRKRSEIHVLMASSRISGARYGMF